MLNFIEKFMLDSFTHEKRFESLIPMQFMLKYGWPNIKGGLFACA